MADHQHPVSGCRPYDLNNKQNEQNKETPEDHEMKQEDWLRFVQEQQKHLTKSLREEREVMREDREVIIRSMREEREVMREERFTFMLAIAVMLWVSVWLSRYS